MTVDDLKPSRLQRVSPNDAQEILRLKASLVRPSSRQLEWQALGQEAIIHFGVNTYTGHEWGSGEESPEIFAPDALDCRQWARAMQAAGIRLAVLVAKHHDGFCLWPGAHTEHSVRHSPWQGGQGDLMREFVLAMGECGIRVGFYLSPADLHEMLPGGRYGNGSTVQPSQIGGDAVLRYELDDYNRYFMNQLHELLTGYGPIHEVWFDGANPKPGTTQTYARAEWYGLIRRLQPDAVIFGGPDARWAGNELAEARPAEWNVLPLPVDPEAEDVGDITDEDAGDSARLGQGRYLAWIAPEADIPLRPGWFYHPDQDSQVRSLSELADVYLRSVGRGANLMLGLAPDTHGLLHPTDAARLAELGDYIRALWASDVAAQATRTASSGDLSALVWSPDAHDPAPWLSLEFAQPVQVNVVALKEDLRTGQQVERFSLEVRRDGVWSAPQLCSPANLEWHGSRWHGSSDLLNTIGACRLLRCQPGLYDGLRLRIQASRGVPHIARVALLCERSLKSIR